jgi:hypothetical protein
MSSAGFRIDEHRGLTLPEFRLGLSRVLLTRAARVAARLIGRSSDHQRFELSLALYQTVLAQLRRS